MNDLLYFAVYFISLVSAFFVATAVHELGHLACGLCSGYTFVSFRLLRWTWAKDSQGKLRVSAGTGLSGLLGQCLMAPSADEGRYRFVLYNAGGGLANLVLGVLCTAALFLVPNVYVQASMLAFAVINLMFGAVNLIPRRNPIPNDGANIREARRSAEAAHGLYLMLRVNGALADGAHLTDFPEGMFAVSETADLSNYLIANTMLLRASQLDESGSPDESYRTLLRIRADKLPSFYAAQVTLNLMFFELVHDGGEAAVALARKRIESKQKDKQFQKILNMRHPAFLSFQAAKAAFLDNDTDKAQALTAQARELNAALPNPGERHSNALMLERLEEKMR